MFIEEIILQGFKTYANRSVISEFDPQFNAITGLNGSGKSNILDAIQFLLGSTNKEMLRVTNGLAELITNGGGNNKASVSIKFKCIDKKMRPTGYQNCEELLVTRQITKEKVTKFFVNGLSSNLTKVKSLFRSVHLNIDNPHFLVKQGRISKIVNLKPIQLLGMIEQTAGTAIYNKTKMDSERMIEKKELKLNSINQILKTSIQPQMNKLNADRQRYTLFKNRESEMKELHESLKTYEFVTKHKLLQKKWFELNDVRDTVQIKQGNLLEQVERLAQLEGQIKILRNTGTNKVYVQYNKARKMLIEVENDYTGKKKRIQKLTTESINLKQEMNKIQEVVERRRQELEWKSKQLMQNEKQKEQTDGLLNEINLSKGSEGDAQKILQKQLKQEQTQICEFRQEIKTMNVKLKNIKNQKITDEKNQNQFEQTKGSLSELLNVLQNEISELSKLTPPKQVQDPQLTSNYLRKLEGDRKRILDNHYPLRFSYNDPQPNFDRSKVKGKLFMLFKVKERAHEKALQIGAGGKLNNIVVLNQNVSKLVIERQTFGKNVAIVPNNKITFKQFKSNVIQEVKRIGQSMNGFARPAYELIQYDKSIENSIMFGFSNFIVCSNSDIARKIAYNSSLNCKCVTFDGDILEPGTLTGGHMKMGQLLIATYRELREVEDKIKEERRKFEGDKTAYVEYKKRYEEYKEKKKDLEAKKTRRQKIKQRITNLTLTMKKRNFEQEIAAIDERIQSLYKELQVHEKKQQELMNKQKKGGKSINDQKKQIISIKKQQETKINDLKKTSSQLQVDMDNFTKKIEQMKANDDKYQQQIINMERQINRLESQVRNCQLQFEQKQFEKDKIEKQQAMNESRLKLLLEQESTLKSEHRKNESQLTTMKKQIDSTQRLLQVTEAEVKQIQKQCPWLDTNKQYEISEDFNYQQANRKLKEISIDVDKLRKTVKITIDDHSYEKLQEEYRNLRQKKDTLQKDKITLLNNMKDLDDKRTKTLESCYGIVKDNLGKIFNDLLPGATAHLNLVDRNDVTQGAQLKIQFNKVQKELSELSGGQRSLLALSFILALLLYKPSPFYILDEIDSALDLSHTQNIGYMISQRFPQSQFLIISLKQGMYQNANLLYKVHFADGESKVERQKLKKK